VANEKEAVCRTHEDKRHTFEDGDYVKFVEVEGMTQLNGHAPIKIKDCKAHSFTLDCDTSSFDLYIRQGLVENVKVPKDVSYHSLAKSVKDPVASSAFGMLETPDMRFWGRSNHTHCAVRALHQFHEENKRYPAHGNEAEVQAVYDAACKLWDNADEALDEKFVKVSARFASCSISPMAAFFGGFLAQEVIKKTGKYIPLKQWMHYDISEAVPTGEVDRTVSGSRYDDQIKIFGNEIQEKLGNVKTFMVGSGALGCELIKAMAVMGLACGPKGHLTVTDNDNIEVSNLSRQFLFRQKNVGGSKAETSCEIAKTMNPDLKVRPLTILVAPATENVFDEDFWSSLDFVVNAVDNVKARNYVDGKCVWFEKPLLESGTLGTKANSQMIVPHKSLSYTDI
jgi:ubiquitin-activating enzyme E1